MKKQEITKAIKEGLEKEEGKVENFFLNYKYNKIFVAGIYLYTYKKEIFFTEQQIKNYLLQKFSQTYNTYYIKINNNCFEMHNLWDSCTNDIFKAKLHIVKNYLQYENLKKSTNCIILDTNEIVEKYKNLQ